MTTEDQGSVKVGDTLGGKYELVRLLGKGGMGAVFEASNTWTTRRVALKVLRPGIATDPEALERFKREARTATQLAHPNIIDVLDMGRDERTGSLYIVQELLTGTDLHQRLKALGKLSPREALDVMIPVMGALSAAHERGILHRDVKPENIFLTTGAGGEVTPKLIDFGLAKAAGEGDALRMTATGTVMGTPYYMAPEQVRGVKDIDGRADVWAVGAVLFELLSGRVPFDAENYNMLMFKILSEPAPSLGKAAPEVPGPLASVVDGALQSDRERRFPTMRAFLDELLKLKGFDDLSAHHRRSIMAAPVAKSAAVASELAFAPTGQWDTPPSPAALAPEADASAGLAPVVTTGQHATPFGWGRQNDPPPKVVPQRSRRAGAVALAGIMLGLLGAAGFLWKREPPTSLASAPVTAAVLPVREVPVTPPAPVTPPPAVPSASSADAGPPPPTEHDAVRETANRTRRSRHHETAISNQPRWGWGDSASPSTNASTAAPLDRAWGAPTPRRRRRTP